MEANSDQSQLKENDLFCEWLGETKFAAQVVVDVSDALTLLASKRTTLEEKMIRQELHSLLSNYGEILNILHARLSEMDCPDAAYIEDLRTMNFRVREEMAKLLKALRYNFNYVEQYFEFDFCAHLQQECRFTEEAKRIVQSIKKK